jgi:hypothetical protein
MVLRSTRARDSVFAWTRPPSTPTGDRNRALAGATARTLAGATARTLAGATARTLAGATARTLAGAAGAAGASPDSA